MNKCGRIRVLLTVPHLGKEASPYRQMIGYARHLDRDRFDLTICSLRPSGLEQTAPVLDSLGVPYFIAPFRPRAKSVAGMRESMAAQRAIAERGPYDIQHSLDFTPSPWEAGLARWNRRRYVYHQRNRNEDGSDLALRIKVALSNRIIIIGRHLVDFLKGYGANPSSLALVYNGLDLDEFDATATVAPPLPGDYILAAGNLVKRKRHFDLVRAFHLIRDTYPKLRLVIAGWGVDPAHERELRQLAGSLSLGDRVEFLGTRTDVPLLMRHARLVALCSESEGGSPPWSLLEAMACRTPVVASDIPSHREGVLSGETGLTARVGDPLAIAMAIRKTLDHPEATRERVRRARALVEERHSARNMARRTEELYVEMMGQPVPEPAAATSHSGY